MIIKMTILRLLGSSDDKERIGVARLEGPPLRGSQGSALKALRSKGFEDWRDHEETKSKQSRQRYFSITSWTDAKKITYVGALTWSTSGSFGNTGWTDARKVEYVGAMTQQLRQNLYTGWTNPRYWWMSVQLSRELVFQQLHSPVKPTLHRLITSVDWDSRWSITACWKMHSRLNRWWQKREHRFNRW